jgi:lipopolysaccharide transport system permease protein
VGLQRQPDEAKSERATDTLDGEGRLSALREMWDHRELLYFLTWRDVKVRYKQTALGVLWAIIQPLFTMALFTVLFGRIAHISSDGVPRPIFYFSALLPWLYISTTVTQASMSLVSNSQLITKIYFPRLMLPAAMALGGLVDFLIGSVLLIGFLVYYHIQPGWALLLWPLLVVQMVLLGLAVSLFLAALNVTYRDVKYAVPFMIQLWMFASPVIYPSSLLPHRLLPLAALNPATGLIEAFRHALVPSIAMDGQQFGLSILITVALFVGGLMYFTRTERAFADVI